MHCSNLSWAGSGNFYIEFNQLRGKIESGLKNQMSEINEKLIDDFCSLAINCRLKIFEIIRSNKNINHPAKDVIIALNNLISKIDKFKKQNVWKNDCYESPHSPLDKFVFYYCGDGASLNSIELSKTRNELKYLFLKESNCDDDFFKEFIRVMFVGLLCDLLRLMHKNGLRINFSNEIDVIDRGSLFFVFLEIFKFSESNLNGDEFKWLPWVREKSSCKSLEKLLLNRLNAIRGGKARLGNPIKVPLYSDVNSSEPDAYEVIDTKLVGVVGDLYALHGCSESDIFVARGELPDFSK